MNIDFESLVGLLIAFAIGCRLGYGFYEFKIEMFMSKLKEHNTELLTDTDKKTANFWSEKMSKMIQAARQV